MNDTRIPEARGSGNVERCLVVPRDRLIDSLGTLPVGFRQGGIEAVLGAIRTSGRFVPRPEAEEDPSLKQIIPYCLVEHRGHVFLMRRKRGGGESRLHDKLSIGVGGHVNPVDVPLDGDLSGSVARALDRELDEELRVDSPSRRVELGLLNDDSSEVGRVHLGVVYSLELERPCVAVREEHCLEGEFVDTSTLLRRRTRMETWSRILVPLVAGDRLLRGATPRPSPHET
jgi:predicted NUDIX family phosphoesterase